jgi:uncharacterized membrane protein YvlD (DUF360 family)
MSAVANTLVSLLVLAVALQAIAAVTSAVRVSHWGVALLAASILVVTGWAVPSMVPLLLGPPPHPLPAAGMWHLLAQLGWWQYPLYSFVGNLIGLLLVWLVLPGVGFRGAVGFLVAAVFMTGVDVLLIQVLNLLSTLG